MALQKQNVPINFGGGLDTKTDPKQAIPGSFTVLENAVRPKDKLIAKRPGYQSLGTPIGSASGANVARYKDELLSFENHKVYGYIAKTDSWAERGTAVPCHVETQQIVRNSYPQTKPDSASSGDITVYAYVENSSVKVSVYDEASEAFVISGETLRSGDNPQVIVLGGKICVFLRSSSTIYRYDLDVTTPSSVAAASFQVTDCDGTVGRYDVDSNGTLGVIAYCATTSGDLKLITFSEADDSVSTASLAVDCDRGLNVIMGASGNIWLFHAGSTNPLYYSVVDSTLSTLSSDVAVNGFGSGSSTYLVTGYETDATTLKFWWEEQILEDTQEIRTATADTSGTVTGGGSGDILSDCMLASRVFTYEHEGQTEAYFAIVLQSDIQPTFFILRHDLKVVAKYQVGVANKTLNQKTLPRVTSLGSGQYHLCYGNQGRLVSGLYTSLYTLTGVGRAILDFEPTSPFISAEVGDELIVAGGVVSTYDGANFVEKGFHHFPEINLAASGTATGGAVSASKTYQICAVYEWTDNKGKIHRSAPSEVTSVTTGGSDNAIALEIRTLRITSKSDVLVAIYRTEGGGSVFYRETSPDPSAATAPALLNEPDDINVSYTCKLSDSDLISREILYTTGGVIENIAPPAAAHVAEHNGRAVLSDVEGSDVAWYSKAAREDYPAEFTDLFTIKNTGKGGKVVATGSLDEKLVLFKRDRPYYVYGEGPNEAGIGAFTIPEEITGADVGVEDAASVVKIPAGLAFKSLKGLYVLGRDLSSQYFGAPVEGWNEYTVTGAELHSDVNQIRFTTLDGPCLVFDYLMGQWSVFTNHEARGCTVWQDRFVLIKADGSVYQEDYSLFKDNGEAYNVRAVTGWLSLAGLQSIQRIYRAAFLAELKSPHGLEINIGYDWKEAYDSQITFDSADLEAGEPYQIRSHLSQQKCQAIRFEIRETTDASTSGSHEALTLSAITLEAGVKRGTAKLRSGLTVKAN